MNKTMKYLALLTILPLIAVVMTSESITDAFALKAKGVGTSQYGSATKNMVCGDRLCSEYEGGRAGYEEKLKTPQIPPTIPSEPKMKESMEVAMEETMDVTVEKTMDKSMEKTMETMMEKEHAAPGSLLKLSRANVPAVIPLHQGFYNGESVYYIITDSSEPNHAKIITEKQGWKVELAPLLANAPKSALSTTYMFTNGVEGKGVHGFQNEVFTSTPAQPDVYSALTAHVHVTWNDGQTPEILDSQAAILAAEADGRITLSPLPVVINMPHIMWPGGQMMVKDDKTLTDHMPYGGGQVLDIDTEKMTVTFIAHRGWGPDGSTIYYIVTDATPSGPAGMMGVVSTPTSASLITNSAAVDLFQFGNGISGSGPLGFQPGIAAGAPGDANYSPMWRISVINWVDPNSASVLETKGDIDFFSKNGKIKVGLARPMDSDHIVNCPFIDPFQ